MTDVLDHPLDEPDVGPPTEPDDGWTPTPPTIATSTRWPTSRRRRNLSNREWAERILRKKATMPDYIRRRERPWFRKANALLKRLR